MKRAFQLTSFALLLLAVTGFPARAQQPLQGIAEYIITDTPLEDGSIVILSEKGYAVSTQEYSDDIFGVITDNPAVAISQFPKNTAQAVVSSGSTHVRVNHRGGVIAAGDWITTSGEPGVGMKATRTGMALGRALSPLASGLNEGLVQVVISPQFVSPSDPAGLPKTPRAALSTLQAGFLAATHGGANTNTRYALAVVSLLVALFFAFWIFGRTATNSIAAVGRNPLAKKSIFFVAIINAIMAVGVVGAGLALGLFILAS